MNSNLWSQVQLAYFELHFMKLQSQGLSSKLQVKENPWKMGNLERDSEIATWRG